MSRSRFTNQTQSPSGSNRRSTWANPSGATFSNGVSSAPKKREANRAIGEPEPALSLRIWSHIAAKEAARRLWLSQGFPPIYPADVASETGPDGRLIMSARVDSVDTGRPTVVLAEAEGVVVAAGVLDGSKRIGIAVERFGERGTTTTTLSPTERGWIDTNTTPGTEHEEWTARFEAAKRAVEDAVRQTPSGDRRRL